MLHESLGNLRHQTLGLIEEVHLDRPSIKALYSYALAFDLDPMVQGGAEGEADLYLMPLLIYPPNHRHHALMAVVGTGAAEIKEVDARRDGQGERLYLGMAGFAGLEGE